MLCVSLNASHSLSRKGSNAVTATRTQAHTAARNICSKTERNQRQFRKNNQRCFFHLDQSTERTELSTLRECLSGLGQAVNASILGLWRGL